MKKLLTFLAIVSLSFSPTASAPQVEKATSGSDRLIVAYLTEFRLANYPIKELETRGAGKMITHVLYAFANIANGRPVFDDQNEAYRRVYTARESVDGRADNPADATALRGALNQLRKLKARHPGLKALISIGGANQANSRGYSLASRTDTSREKFVAACLDLFIAGHLDQGISTRGVFDGIDVDWEYPTDCSAGMKGGEGCAPEDTANFTLLLAEFRRQLDELGSRDGKRYQLTIAGSAWVDDYSKYEWRKIHPLLDFINVMTYGLAPPGKTRLHAPLYVSANESGKWAATYNTDYAIKRYLAEGVPADKIVMGVPFYAVGWTGVPNINHGLYQKPAGQSRDTGYDKLAGLTAPGSANGFRLFRDPETRAPWLFNSTTGVFWSFDDPESLAVKMEYVKEMNLRGVMFWEISGDDANSSLLKAIFRGLRQ